MVCYSCGRINKIGMRDVCAAILRQKHGTCRFLDHGRAFSVHSESRYSDTDLIARRLFYLVILIRNISALIEHRRRDGVSRVTIRANVRR